MMTPEDDEEVKALFRKKKVTNDVRRKVLAEKKAYELVKQLIEEDVDKDFFANSVYFLSEQHYQDIIEERSILKLCGYPICDNTVNNVAKQQYRISRNRVYDLTQRKFFCSDRCYKASEHIKKHIPTTPIWMRDTEKFHSIDLDLSGFGAKGEEVIISSRVSDNLDECTEQDNKDESVSDADHVSGTSKNLLKDLPKKQTAKHSVTSASSNANQATRTVLENLLNILKEWITEKTLEYMGLITTKTSVESDHAAAEIRKMKKLKLLEAKLDQVVRGSSKPAPSKDTKIQEQEAADAYTQRVELFYGGKFSQNDGVRFKDVEIKESEAKQQHTIQPRVDSKNQASIRRSILLQKLEKVVTADRSSSLNCKDLFPQLPLVVLSSDLKRFISTFNLTSTNVVLKSNEYSLMSIILLYLMSRFDDDVMSSFNQSQTLIGHLLSAYNTELTPLQRAIDDVIDVKLTKK